MGTKNNPGRFDCYANAEPDEPMFVLLGRDPTASIVVGFWRTLKMAMKQKGESKSSEEKLDEARQCSYAMKAWAEDHGKDTKPAFDTARSLMAESNEFRNVLTEFVTAYNNQSPNPSDARLHEAYIRACIALDLEPSR